MSVEIKAGASYFAYTFGAGFAFGVIRAAALEPRLGRDAVFVELPFIMGTSWILSSRVCKRYSVPAKPMPRLVMGFSAYGMLLVAEALLGMALRGANFADAFRIGPTMADKAGQAAQLLFAFVPLVQSILTGKGGHDHDKAQ